MMDDASRCVRREAVKTFATLCGGTVNKSATLKSCLEHSAADVREQAIECIVQCTQRGDRNAIAAVSALMHDSIPSVQAAAVAALAELAERGDELVFLDVLALV